MGDRTVWVVTAVCIHHNGRPFLTLRWVQAGALALWENARASFERRAPIGASFVKINPTARGRAAHG